ncbi:hypothetical protein MalM25_09400 [Planctomycetes bacterium MalM25]|nr:hypothetical protein MalM25_09400 [Planctomycetes bacterium MalM25]
MADPTASPNVAPLGPNVAPLGVEEYIEQGHFFAMLAERLAENAPAQEVLASAREEVLATTKLPMAIDFLLSELRHAGVMATAVAKLDHYFTPLQAYIIHEGENERGRFDLRVGLEILSREANYRAGLHESSRGGPTVQGLFLYQFEVLCRNRLGYDKGLTAVAADPAYTPDWRDWILAMRHQVGMVDVADLIYVQSEHAAKRDGQAAGAALFGEQEGRIALANRRKDPLYLFNSLHRQLGYPEPPRTHLPTEGENPIPAMARRLEQLEKRTQLLEEEQRGGFDLSKFYEKPPASLD